jgi:hypothetical protein
MTPIRREIANSERLDSWANERSFRRIACTASISSWFLIAWYFLNKVSQINYITVFCYHLYRKYRRNRYSPGFMTTLSITVDDSVARTFRLGAKALSMSTETIIASFLGQTVAGFTDHEFWIQSDQLAGELYNRRYDDRQKAEQVARNCNRFFATARAKGSPLVYVAQVIKDKARDQFQVGLARKNGDQWNAAAFWDFKPVPAELNATVAELARAWEMKTSVREK